MSRINFFYEDVDFQVPHPRKTSSWIKRAVLKEDKKLKELNYIFCSDDYLRQLNIQYLNHTTYTDIVTFDGSEEPESIEGDIFISIERVRENAIKFNNSLEEELHRVIIHGALHLMGYADKTKEEKWTMRKKEDTYLSLLK